MTDIVALPSWLPITAVVALGVFVLREFLEWRRRRATEVRKLRAMKRIVARECVGNHRSILRLIEAYELIQTAKVAEDPERLRISQTRTGHYSIMIHNPDGTGSGWNLRPIQRDTLLKHLSEVAALDDELFKLCEIVISVLESSAYSFSMLVHGPEPHWGVPLEVFYGAVPVGALAQLRAAEVELEKLHVFCTGESLPPDDMLGLSS